MLGPARSRWRSTTTRGNRWPPRPAARGLRIDIPAAAGEAFYVKVATTASAVDLSLANLVSQAGGTLAVFGTGADDAFTFDASGRRISINGLVYQFTAAEATNVTFDGGPGNNAATLKGTADSETAKLYPGRADLQGAGYEVHVVNTASITFDGNGGADQAYLNDSDGDDTFVARLGDCMLSGVSSAGIGYSSRAERRPRERSWQSRRTRRGRVPRVRREHVCPPGIVRQSLRQRRFLRGEVLRGDSAGDVGCAG